MSVTLECLDLLCKLLVGILFLPLGQSVALAVCGCEATQLCHCMELLVHCCKISVSALFLRCICISKLGCATVTTALSSCKDHCMLAALREIFCKTMRGCSTHRYLEHYKLQLAMRRYPNATSLGASGGGGGGAAAPPPTSRASQRAPAPRRRCAVMGSERFHQSGARQPRSAGRRASRQGAAPLCRGAGLKTACCAPDGRKCASSTATLPRHCDAAASLAPLRQSCEGCSCRADRRPPASVRMKTTRTTMKTSRCAACLHICANRFASFGDCLHQRQTQEGVRYDKPKLGMNDMLGSQNTEDCTASCGIEEHGCHRSLRAAIRAVYDPGRT